MVAHVLGMPLEEAVAPLIPVGVALIVATRATLARLFARDRGEQR